MAGSYEHLKRDPDEYGGVDTSLCENMGDAVEAMTHMYWMIHILAKGDRKLIKAVSKEALEIEVGRTEPPDFG
jgi:hypothetical protein